MAQQTGYSNALTGSALRGNVLGLTGKVGTSYVSASGSAQRTAYLPEGGSLGEYVAMSGLGRLVQGRAQPRLSGVGQYYDTASLRGFGGALGLDILGWTVPGTDPGTSIATPDPGAPDPIQKGLTTPDPVTGLPVLRPDIGQAACGDKMKYDPATQTCLPIPGSGGPVHPKPVVLPAAPPAPVKADLLHNPIFWAAALVLVGGGAIVIAKHQKKAGGSLHANRRSRRRGGR